MKLTTSSEMTALAIDGKIESVSFATGGLAAHDLVFAALKAKYGEPVALRSTPMQNGYGASFDAILAIWHTKDVNVVYQAGNAARDSGSVQVSTSKGFAALAEIDKKNDEAFDKSRPKF
jgi:hypothetical protein